MNGSDLTVTTETTAIDESGDIGGSLIVVSDVDASDGLDSDELATLCENSANHGQYVSQVAKSSPDEDRLGDYDRHGQWVSEAASSDCGKTEAVDETPADPEPAGSAVVDPSDGLDTEELTTLCENSANHGQYVSQVAKTSPANGKGSDYRNHGKWVSEAAQGDCGASGVEASESEDSE